MATVFINIGSNLGNRRLNLSKAMRAIGQEFGPFELSHTVESAPWGFESNHTFLNVGMAFSSDLSPEEILSRLQSIEKRLSPGNHRNPDGTYSDRYVDIDIVAIDRLTINTPGLRLPHRHLPEREFFLRPLEELAPGWTHPENGLTPSEMLEALSRSQEGNDSGK